ncbi:MAG TPA: 2,3-bisphosphoglycerate-independent phosphoglycerate mutase, partial [Xanthomonadaceae bacterium]|nr:2,3-bisphosphoglycerate-independent phosphoglycerate mutase [Xanthomonadaceae bacterium]
IADGEFQSNPALLSACRAARAGGTLHVMGLVSPGGVHSHEKHILSMLDLAKAEGVGRVVVHAFLDGRDPPPRSARPSLEALEARCAALGNARVASVSGRYWAMDRDKRWDRVEKAWSAITEAAAEFSADSAVAALDAAYVREENDEFVKPTIVGGGCRVEDGDAVAFMNFRADRARELSQAFLLPDFDGFPRKRAIRLACFVSLTEYSADIPSTVAYGPQTLTNTLPEYLSAKGLTQLRIAETEKYAHVTFFFNGGREEPFDGEDRIMVPSPKVATYDLKPEMSCPEVTDRLVEAIGSGKYDFIVCNIANPDMVGHTGVFAAAVRAVEVVDEALGRLRAAIEQAGGEMLVSADHGNLEQMQDHDTGQPHTAHTHGPVPLVYLGRPARLRGGGALKDLAPTVLALMGLPQPAEMGGESLVEFA